MILFWMLIYIHYLKDKNVQNLTFQTLIRVIMERTIIKPKVISVISTDFL